MAEIWVSLADFVVNTVLILALLAVWSLSISLLAWISNLLDRIKVA
ncbi:MAG: hypothetical protein NZ954_05895 [Thermofilaceae archaeon]|nr:hypothetical protein [Thermofilaceae archaeon]MCX8179854.1 hypothetical protein [Thermofilaceae archaeon]MDW8004461.1 hypothetical protein [Thermofilaceae archaeon]